MGAAHPGIQHAVYQFHQEIGRQHAGRGHQRAAGPETADPAAARAQSPFTVLLAVGGVWLVATIVFSCLNMLGFHASHAWLAFIYAIPASFLMTEVFAIRWKLPAILHLLFSSGILWTLMVSIHLSRPQVENIYLIYVIAAVAQLLGIFGLGLYWQMIHLPRNEWKQMFHRRKRRKTESANNPKPAGAHPTG